MVQLSHPYMTMGNYLAIKRREVKKKKGREVPIHGVTWINLVNVMPSGRSESQWALCGSNRTKCRRQAALQGWHVGQCLPVNKGHGQTGRDSSGAGFLLVLMGIF